MPNKGKPVAEEWIRIEIWAWKGQRKQTVLAIRPNGNGVRLSGPKLDPRAELTGSLRLDAPAMSLLMEQWECLSTGCCEGKDRR